MRCIAAKVTEQRASAPGQRTAARQLHWLVGRPPSLTWSLIGKLPKALGWFVLWHATCLDTVGVCLWIIKGKLAGVVSSLKIIAHQLLAVLRFGYAKKLNVFHAQTLL